MSLSMLLYSENALKCNLFGIEVDCEINYWKTTKHVHSPCSNLIRSLVEQPQQHSREKHFHFTTTCKWYDFIERNRWEKEEWRAWAINTTANCIQYPFRIQ